MKSKLVLALSLLITALFPMSAFSADPPKTLVCEVKVVTAEGDGTIRKLFVKGTNWRGEMTTQGMLFRTIKNSQGLFTLHPSDRFALQYPTGTTRDLPQSFVPCPIDDFDGYFKRVEAKTGEQTTFEGKKCDVYTYDDPQSSTACKFLMQSEKQVPVQIEMIGKDGKKATIVYSTYSVGEEIADVKFQLPKNIPIRMRRAPDILKDKAAGADKPPAAAADAKKTPAAPVSAEKETPAPPAK